MNTVLTIGTAARLLGISVDEIRDLISAGEIEAVGSPGSPQIVEESLFAYAARSGITVNFF